MWIFKLETGVAIIIYLDLIVFISQIMTMNYQLRKSSSDSTAPATNTTEPIELTIETNETSFLLFNFVTDYTTIMLMAVKLYTGLNFLVKLIF